MTRFILAVPSHREALNLVAIEVGSRRTERPDQAIDGLANMLEGRT